MIPSELTWQPLGRATDFDPIYFPWGSGPFRFLFRPWCLMLWLRWRGCFGSSQLAKPGRPPFACPLALDAAEVWFSGSLGAAFHLLEHTTHMTLSREGNTNMIRCLKNVSPRIAGIYLQLRFLFQVHLCDFIWQRIVADFSEFQCLWQRVVNMKWGNIELYRSHRGLSIRLNSEAVRLLPQLTEVVNRTFLLIHDALAPRCAVVALDISVKCHGNFRESESIGKEHHCDTQLFWKCSHSLSEKWNAKLNRCPPSHYQLCFNLFQFQSVLFKSISKSCLYEHWTTCFWLVTKTSFGESPVKVMRRDFGHERREDLDSWLWSLALQLSNVWHVLVESKDRHKVEPLGNT